MTCYRAIVLVSMFCFACLGSQTAWAQAGTITKGMQDNCANDYRTFCGDYGLQTSALNLCMRKAGPEIVARLRAGAGSSRKSLAS
jgi:hypothetical protein